MIRVIPDAIGRLGRGGLQVVGGGVAADSLTVGLLAYYKLDEASGNALDVLGNYPLTQAANPLGVVGKIGNARQFLSASTQYLRNTSLVLPDTDWTISAWVNIATLTNFAAVINKWSAANKGQMAAYIDTNQITFAIYSDSAIIGSAARHSTFGNLSTGTWYHMILERQKTAGIIRIGINLTFNQANADGVIGTTGIFALAAKYYNETGPLNGIIDEVGIWTRLLTTDELARLYNNT
jgi:hypothetical protein